MKLSRDRTEAVAVTVMGGESLPLLRPVRLRASAEVWVTSLEQVAAATDLA